MLESIVNWVDAVMSHDNPLTCLLFAAIRALLKGQRLEGLTAAGAGSPTGAYPMAHRQKLARAVSAAAAGADKQRNAAYAARAQRADERPKEQQQEQQKEGGEVSILGSEHYVFQSLTLITILNRALCFHLRSAFFFL